MAGVREFRRWNSRPAERGLHPGTIVTTANEREKEGSAPAIPDAICYLLSAILILHEPTTD